MRLRIRSVILIALGLATAAYGDGAPGPVLYMSPILPNQVYYPFFQPNGFGGFGAYGLPYGAPYGVYYSSSAYGMSAYQPFSITPNNIFFDPIQYSLNQLPNGMQVNAFISGGNALAPWNGMAGWTGTSGAPYLYYQAPGRTGVQWTYGVASPPVWGTSAQIIDPLYFTRPQCDATQRFNVFGTPFVLCGGIPLPAFLNGPIPSMIYFPVLQKPATTAPPLVPVVQGAALPTGARVNSGGSKKPANP